MSLSFTTVLTRKGQTTIPVEFREKLGIEEGDRLVWTLTNGELKVASAREVIRQTAGIFKDRVPPLPPGGIEQRMAEEEEAMANAFVKDWNAFHSESSL